MRVAAYLCTLHLWTLFSLAASNILAGLSLVAFVVSNRWVPVPWRRFGYALAPLGVYAVLVLFSTTQSEDVLVSLDRSSQLLALANLPLCLLLLRGERCLRRVLDGLILVGLLVAVQGLAQAVLWQDPDFGLSDLTHRIRGPFSHHMTLAGFLMMASAAAIAQLARGVRRHRAGRLVAVVVMVCALATSLTRSAWLGLAAAIVVVGLLEARRWLLAIPLLVVVALLIGPAPVAERLGTFTSFESPADGDRLAMWRSGAEMIRSHPLWGVGPGMVRPLYAEYLTPDAVRTNVLHLHSSYIQAAAENGLPALGALLWLLLATGRHAFRGLRAPVEAGAPRDLYLASLVAVVAFGLAGLFEDNWSDTEVQRLLFFFLAIPGCLQYGRESFDPLPTDEERPRSPSTAPS